VLSAIPPAPSIAYVRSGSARIVPREACGGVEVVGMRRLKLLASLSLLAAALLVGPAAYAQKQEFVIIFGTDRSEITSEAHKIIELIAARARAEHPAAIAVAGYGDGETAHDAVLGKRRAEAVIRALEEAGIAQRTLKRVPPLPPDKATGIPVHKVTVTLQP
jgi:outer membrane protein OmpA-like peptidoglycan-associated protein